MADFLIKHGANPNVRDENGKNAYEFAIQNGNSCYSSGMNF